MLHSNAYDIVEGDTFSLKRNLGVALPQSTFLYFYLFKILITRMHSRMTSHPEVWVDSRGCQVNLAPHALYTWVVKTIKRKKR